jgi:hypothetical protein
MDDFKVPTVEVEAAVLGHDGIEVRGVIFTPAFSAVHHGPMGTAEWINGPTQFFPFRRPEDEQAILLNKRQVLSLSVANHEGGEEQDESAGLPSRQVVVEVGSRRFEGRVVIDMPVNQQRILDYINRSEAFLQLHGDDGRDYYIPKEVISRITQRGA